MTCRYSSLMTTQHAALFRSLLQASQFTKLLPAVCPSTSSRSSKAEQLVQFASRAFIVSVHETGTNTFPSICVMSAMTFDSSQFPAFSSTQAVLLLVSTKRTHNKYFPNNNNNNKNYYNLYKTKAVDTD